MKGPRFQEAARLSFWGARIQDPIRSGDAQGPRSPRLLEGHLTTTSAACRTQFIERRDVSMSKSENASFGSRDKDKSNIAPLLSLGGLGKCSHRIYSIHLLDYTLRCAAISRNEGENPVRPVWVRPKRLVSVEVEVLDPPNSIQFHDCREEPDRVLLKKTRSTLMMT